MIINRKELNHSLEMQGAYVQELQEQERKLRAKLSHAREVLESLRRVKDADDLFNLGEKE